MVSNNGIEELVLLSKLKEIILKEDRESLKELEQTINDPVKFSEKVTPIVEQHLLFIKKNFPKEFRVAVNQIVEQKIKASQDELLDIIYPTLGKMIRKYIAQQLQEMRDGIDDRLHSIFSLKSMVRRAKSFFTGVSESELMLTGLNLPTIEEVYLIERDSGLLMGTASLNPTINRDVIAGMLTAIKAFVEDAFQRESEELETIEYGTYKIMIHNIHSYYMAMAISGVMGSTEREQIKSMMLDFVIAESTLIKQSDVSDNRNELISKKLDEYFILPQRNKSKNHI